MTGTLLNGTKKNGSVLPEAGSHRVIFDPSSHSDVSHIISVVKKPLIVRAYNLAYDETIDIMQFCAKFNLQLPIIIDGRKWQLSPTNTLFVINIPGDYKFKLNAALGYVTCMADESEMVYHQF